MVGYKDSTHKYNEVKVNFTGKSKLCTARLLVIKVFYDYHFHLEQLLGWKCVSAGIKLSSLLNEK